MLRDRTTSRRSARTAVLFLTAAALCSSCATVERAVVGPVEALVTIPGAAPGQTEQYIVEASASRSCQAGVRAFRNQEWELAITAFEQTLLEDPDDEHAHFALGVAYELTGRVDKALEHYEIANRLPRRPNPSYAMSVERARTKLSR